MQPTNQPSEDFCYRAVCSRDARFDGRFYAAVVTTGIYCRPLCPAVTPQRRHVRFYPCAAAAEEAGYRPCRRCRPDAAPGAPAWLGTTATVRRDGAPIPVAGEGLGLRLPVRTPYDWNSLIAFLAPRAIPGVEQVTPDSYRRSVLVDGAPHYIEVTFEPEPPRLVFCVRPPLTRGLIEVVERIKALFDADADPLPIDDHLRRDAGLARLVRARPGLRVPGAWDGFELGVRAILGQQISVAGATTLAGRLAQAFGARTPDETSGATRLFPTAERLAEADIAKIGLPGARARALSGFARDIAESCLSLSPAAPIEETRTRLLAIPGLGPWTVEYVALRALRDPDAFPAGDLGLRRALSVEGTLVSEKELRERSEAWRPWRAYAAMHLWTSLSSTVSRKKHARSS